MLYPAVLINQEMISTSSMFLYYGRNQKPSLKQVQRRFQMCVQFKNNLLQVQTKNNILVYVPRKNTFLPGVQRRNKTRTINMIKMHICGQSSQRLTCSQYQDQQNYNLSTRKEIKWISSKCPWKMTITVNLPSFIRNLCVLTRTVKKMKILIWGQWSNQWICSYPNQQYHTRIQDYEVTKTGSLQDVTRNLNILRVTKTVNLCGQRCQVKYESEGQMLCSQYHNCS